MDKIKPTAVGIGDCTFRNPEYSKWRCYLFEGAGGTGMVWRPLKDQEPNWFWRKMQYLCFGNRWVKDEEIQP